MRVAIFGATGRLGRELIQASLAAGHCVTAHSRRASSKRIQGLPWVSDVADAVRDADAVFAAFGPGSPADKPFCSAETQHIVDVMRSLRRRRFLCVTGAMVGDYRANRTWCFQRMTRWIQRRYPESMNDRTEQERVIRFSDLDWTIFKPCRLTSNPAKGKAAAGPAVRVGMLSSVSRARLARLMVHEAVEGRFLRQAVFVKE